MLKKIFSDFILLLFIFLLIISLVLFALDIFVYPFGLILLIIAIWVRSAYLKER